MVFVVQTGTTTLLPVSVSATTATYYDEAQPESRKGTAFPRYQVPTTVAL